MRKHARDFLKDATFKRNDTKEKIISARISLRDYAVLKGKKICISTTVRKHLEKVARALEKRELE